MKPNELITLLETLVEAEMQIVKPQVNVQVALDLDGVIADFDTGVTNSNAGVKQAKANYEKLLSGFPDLKGLPDDDIKRHLAGPQTDPGKKALKKALNYYREQKFIPTGKEGFFLNLPVMPGAVELISGVTRLTGKKPFALTAPVDTNSARCEQEKKAWVEKNFPGMFSGFVCTQEKEKYANANTVLIDDRTKYTNKFVGAGGKAILFKSTPQALQDLEVLLKTSFGA